MKRKQTRPVNLDLRTISLPVSAVTSILHRVSGVIMLFAIGILLFMLERSLSSPVGFLEVKNWMANSFISKFIIWGICTALIYHVIGGIRHLMMDMGYFEELESGTKSANMTIILSVICSAFVGLWLW